MHRAQLMSRIRGFLTKSIGRLLGSNTSEPPSPRLDALDQYQKAVEIVGTDGELSEAELRCLGVLEHELGLSQQRAAGVEREVMGAAKEEIVVRTDGADRYSIKSAAKGIYRDPMRSTHDRFVKTSGLRWVCLMLLVPVPWARRVWALPFLSVLAPSERYAAQRAKRHKKITDWARQALSSR
jgi:hypothetical protein